MQRYTVRFQDIGGTAHVTARDIAHALEEARSMVTTCCTPSGIERIAERQGVSVRELFQSFHVSLYEATPSLGSNWFDLYDFVSDILDEEEAFRALLPKFSSTEFGRLQAFRALTGWHRIEDHPRYTEWLQLVA